MAFRARTLYDKIWDDHCVKDYGSGEALLYVDRHLVQEVSSPQAFAGLDRRGLRVRRPDAHLAVADHAVSTRRDHPPAPGSDAAAQLARLVENVARHAMPYIPVDDPRHGIVHVIGPELGFTLPGCTLVCGDSHTSTHGAFGALAFGIGTSECEAVFATQTLRQTKQKQMRITLTGTLGAGVSAKDVILFLIGRIGTGGARGHVIEFCGPAVSAMAMEERMTLCNMAIEAGARVGMIAPDRTCFEYLQGRPLAPAGAMWDAAVAVWETLFTDPAAQFDRELAMDVSALQPQVTWGTTPADCTTPGDAVPPAGSDGQRRRRLDYMGLKGGESIRDIGIDRVFIGSCTNGRIDDLRRSARVIAGRKVAPNVAAMVVPGSAAVRQQAEAEGLDRIFIDAGFEWRDAGCSMCVAMNEDRLGPGERCASTSNRNFEGRQGQDGRTHLMSPEMAAAAAITGRITDVRALLEAIHG